MKGVARRFKGISGDFEVLNSIFGVSAISGTVSLRSKLEKLAHWEYVSEESECTYEWTAAYQQIWTHVAVRIRLIPTLGTVTDEVINGLKLEWQDEIQTIWNNRWACARSGELPCRLSFEAQWVDAEAHHTVWVWPGSGRANMKRWFEISKRTAAHEFGHMLGNADEYFNMFCLNRNPVNTGTIMDDGTDVPSRLVQQHGDNIGSDIVAP
ncbi:MAG TPA: hypothetical protein VMW27_05260 [Thermoanaerobaculia bacterium]|nr:hypothetical protein [Thermoanaerobaculia bacterium]